MTAVSPLAREVARRAFARRMPDAVTITRGGLGETDDVTLETDGLAADAVEVYAGPARCGKASGDAQVSLGEGELATRSMPLYIPFDAELVQVNDVVVVTAAIDPKNAGTSWRVSAVDGGGSWNALTTLTLTGWYPSSYWDGS